MIVEGEDGKRCVWFWKYLDGSFQLFQTYQLHCVFIVETMIVNK